jgi:hypothetical protein
VAIVPYRQTLPVPGPAGTAKLTMVPAQTAGLPVPSQAATPPPQYAPLIPAPRATLAPDTAAALGPLAALAARAGLPVPQGTPDALGPVSPAGRMVKGKLELPMSGGSEPGGVGIAAWAGPGSWSDDRMPFTRAHFIPVAIPGLQSVALGALGPAGLAGVPEPKRAWLGGQALKPQAGTPSPDMSNELGAFRLPYSLSVPQRAYDLLGTAGHTGGPYTVGSGGVLPPAGVDPYGSLPEFLQAPLTGGPAGMSGSP